MKLSNEQSQMGLGCTARTVFVPLQSETTVAHYESLADSVVTVATIRLPLAQQGHSEPQSRE